MNNYLEIHENGELIIIRNEEFEIVLRVLTEQHNFFRHKDDHTISIMSTFKDPRNNNVNSNGIIIHENTRIVELYRKNKNNSDYLTVFKRIKKYFLSTMTPYIEESYEDALNNWEIFCKSYMIQILRDGDIVNGNDFTASIVVNNLNEIYATFTNKEDNQMTNLMIGRITNHIRYYKIIEDFANILFSVIYKDYEIAYKKWLDFCNSIKF